MSTKDVLRGSYEADDLDKPDERIHVQKRITFYLGDHPYDTALREIIDNSVDEVREGGGGKVTLTLFPDGSIEVGDDGRGIPVGVNKKTGDNGIIMSLARTGSGGKFKEGNYSNTASMGLNGIGAAATCVTSARLTCVVYRNNKMHTMEFQNGVPGHFTNAVKDSPSPTDPFKASNDLKVAPDTRPASVKKKHPTGTVIRYWANPVFFPASDFLDLEGVIKRVKLTAFLVPTLRVEIEDKRDVDNPKSEVFDYDGGITEMLDIFAPAPAINEPIHIVTEGSFTETIQSLEDGQAVTRDVVRRVTIDAALAWNTGYDYTTYSFVNTVYTPLGGTHERGLERALAKVLIDKISSTRGLMKAKDEPPTLEDIQEGLTSVLSISLPEPPFIGQDKQRLGGQVIATTLHREIASALEKWVNNRKNADQLKVILTKIANASHARQTARAQKEVARRKTALNSASMPAKLLDCLNPNTEHAELLICEGDSALGTLKAARDSNYQALFPIRGKIINTHKSTLVNSLKNAEVAAIVQVIGAGVGSSFDVDKMRMNKVIIAADADVDGAHIAVLLVTMFYNLMPELISAGRLYVAAPPLFAVKTGPKGDNVRYAEDEIELNALLAELAKSKTTVSDVKRLKGLGEMEAEDFWITTLNPETRTLRRVVMPSKEDTLATVDLAMGPSVPPRKDWIMSSRSLVSDEDLSI